MAFLPPTPGERHFYSQPTTRRLRYLFYRQRAWWRARHVWHRSSTSDGASHNSTNARYDYSGYEKQVEKTYPKIVGSDPLDDGGGASIFIPGHGQAPDTWHSVFYEVHGIVRHGRLEYVKYQRRRRLSLPPLKHLPKLPWAGSKPTRGERRGFPFMKYPSGQFNLKGWLFQAGTNTYFPVREGWEGLNVSPSQVTFWINDQRMTTPWKVQQEFRDQRPDNPWGFFTPIEPPDDSE